MMTDAKKHVEGKANDEGGHDAALASVRDANYDERGGRRTKRRMRKRMGMKRTRRWRTTTRRRRRRRRMGKKKRTAMRGMRSVGDYNINSNGDKAVRGEVPVPLDRVCRGQAAARKLKRDATRKERKAAAARKWEEANATRKAKKAAKRRARKATRGGTISVPSGTQGSSNGDEAVSKATEEAVSAASELVDQVHLALDTYDHQCSTGACRTRGSSKLKRPSLQRSGGQAIVAEAGGGKRASAARVPAA